MGALRSRAATVSDAALRANLEIYEHLDERTYVNGSPHLRSRWRRLRHRYDPSDAADFDEFHVVRNGVDADAIIGRLERSFAEVDLVTYWSTFSRPLQWLGEHANLTSCFGTLASGRKAA